jgi:catechol 2,3-dioxygenase-like lactoylglutathione lyase family enzyme
MEVLSSRLLIRSPDTGRARRFYRDVLGLAIYREFGPAGNPGVVFFAGQGSLEVSPAPDAPPAGEGRAADGPPRLAIWLQVRDVAAEHARLAEAGVTILRGPERELWGLIEMWIEDPDGTPIALVQVPGDHPLRRDPR